MWQTRHHSQTFLSQHLQKQVLGPNFLMNFQVVILNTHTFPPSSAVTEARFEPAKAPIDLPVFVPAYSSDLVQNLI